MSFLPKIASADDLWPGAGRVADTASTLGAGVRGALAVLGAAVARVIAWRLHRKATSDLAALDDRMLRDMGLNRGDIVRAVRRGRAATADWQRHSMALLRG